MKIKDWVPELVAMGLGILVLVCLALVVLQPLFEARTFNKFTTGPKATYWDALWVQLRVTP